LERVPLADGLLVGCFNGAAPNYIRIDAATRLVRWEREIGGTPPPPLIL
jgi:hypothetical protein